MCIKSFKMLTCNVVLRHTRGNTVLTHDECDTSKCVTCSWWSNVTRQYGVIVTHAWWPIMSRQMSSTVARLGTISSPSWAQLLQNVFGSSYASYFQTHLASYPLYVSIALCLSGLSSDYQQGDSSPVSTAALVSQVRTWTSDQDSLWTLVRE